MNMETLMFVGAMKMAKYIACGIMVRKGIEKMLVKKG